MGNVGSQLLITKHEPRNITVIKYTARGSATHRQTRRWKDGEEGRPHHLGCGAARVPLTFAINIGFQVAVGGLESVVLV